MSKLVKWKWRDYYTLVEDGERRHYVLSILGTGCELLTWDVDNRKLVPLTPEHPIAERIRAIPETEASRDELLEACQAACSYLGDMPSARTLRKRLSTVIANAVKDADATPA